MAIYAPSRFEEGFEIFEAACEGDLARIEELVAQGVDPGAPTRVEAGFEPFDPSHYDGAGRPCAFEGFTPLMAAAGHGHLDCVRFLAGLAPIEALAQAESDPMEQWSALAFAAFAGHARCVKLLLDLGASPWPDADEPPILALASSREAPNMEAIELLLDALPQAARAFHPGRDQLISWPAACAHSGQPQALRLAMSRLGVDELRSLCPEHSAQSLAVGSGSLETLRLTLLWLDPDARTPGEPTPLMLAALQGKSEMVSELCVWFDLRETFHAAPSSFHFWPDGGNALSFAARGSQSAQTLRLLIRLGSPAQPESHGWTPLMLACGAGDSCSPHAETGLALLDLGLGQIHARDRLGRDAAMIALESFSRWEALAGIRRRSGASSTQADPTIELIGKLCSLACLDQVDARGESLMGWVQKKIASHPTPIALAAAAALERRAIAQSTLAPPRPCAGTRSL